MNRSDCPISNALDHLGDKWSLLIIRDIAFYRKNSYSALLDSAEGIATNILSKRLTDLEHNNIIQRQKDPTDGRRQIYSLTEAGIDLLPILVEMILWSEKYYGDSLTIPEDLVKNAKEDRESLLEQLRQMARSN